MTPFRVGWFKGLYLDVVDRTYQRIPWLKRNTDWLRPVFSYREVLKAVDRLLGGFITLVY